MAEHAAAICGATCALLTRLDSRAGELRTAAALHCPDEIAAQLASLDSGAFGHVVRTRAPVLRSGLDAAPLGSVMHAPIELGPRLYGVLTVGHEEPGRFGEDDLELLVQLARSSAAAIANAIDFQRERRIARALTLGFVPESLPRAARLRDRAALRARGGRGDRRRRVRRLAASATAKRGGAGGRRGRQGRGDRRAQRDGALLHRGPQLGRAVARRTVLEQANSMLLGRLPRDAFVTAFLGILTSDSLRYTNAGHLPPLHVRGERAAAARGHGLPLGVMEGQTYASSELELGARRPRVRAHGRADRGAPRGRDVRRGAARPLRGGRRARRTRPNELVRAVHEEVTGWADGDLRRRRGARAAARCALQSAAHSA